jgi:hypothetical protein
MIWAVSGVVYWAVGRAVRGDNAVYWTVLEVVDRTVRGAVYEAVDGFVHEDSEHPHLQDFLLDVGTDA